MSVKRTFECALHEVAPINFEQIKSADELPKRKRYGNSFMDKLSTDIFHSVFAVPPDRISIKDDTGVERSTVVGPYSEGDIITLSCEVFGGKCLYIIYRTGGSIGDKSEKKNRAL